MSRIRRCHVDRIYLTGEEFVQRSESICLRSRLLGQRLSFIQVQVDHPSDFHSFIILQVPDMDLGNKSGP